MAEDLNTGQHISVAILFGDIKGSTAEAEVDEEATVAKLREYERVVNRTVQQFSPSHYKVRYEGDGFMAVFDTAKSMVECGVAIRDEFRKREWLVRLGGHFGEAYRNDDGDILGADVNRAARIQSGADAGEFFVSATVRHIVRNKSRDVAFRAHPPLSAKGIPEPLEVFEVITPEEAQQPRPRKPPAAAVVSAPERRRWSGAAVAGAALGVAVLGVAGSMMATAFYQHLGLRFDKQQELPAEVADVSRSGADSRISLEAEAADGRSAADKDVVAVLTFDNQRQDDEHSWFSKALQTTLTTELNAIKQLKVVSIERIQRVADREDIDRMEAARRLGVNRFVAGSFAVYGDEMRIDAWVVETANGIQSAASSVEGTQKDFFKLQKDIARATLEHFHVQVAEAAETEVKTAKKSSVDKYRQLLGAEGVISGGTVRVRKKAEPQASNGGIVPRFVIAAVGWCHERLVSRSYAEAKPFASMSEVMQFLEAYRSAHESGDIERLAALYQSLPESQRASVKAYMSNIEDLKVELSDVDVDIGEHEVTVSYTRVDSFTDAETGEDLALEVRLTKFLVRQDGALKFATEPEE